MPCLPARDAAYCLGCRSSGLSRPIPRAAQPPRQRLPITTLCLVGNWLSPCASAALILSRSLAALSAVSCRAIRLMNRRRSYSVTCFGPLDACCQIGACGRRRGLPQQKPAQTCMIIRRRSETVGSPIGPLNRIPNLIARRLLEDVAEKTGILSPRPKLRLAVRVA